MGLTNILLEVWLPAATTHCVVAFDTPARTKRHELYPAYKESRQKQPEEISFSIPWCKKIVAGLNIPVLEMDGYEADDIIGTLATQAALEGFEVIMYTPDKDYLQLVSKSISVLRPGFMKSPATRVGVAEVLKKYDIHNVDQVRDILALGGDKVDNVPGVAGVGEKTASKLVKAYTDVEGVLKHADEIGGSLGEKIRAAREDLPLSKSLVTIDKNVPIDFDSEASRKKAPNREVLEPILHELELRTLHGRLFGKKDPSSPGGNAASPDQGVEDALASPPRVFRRSRM